MFKHRNMRDHKFKKVQIFHTTYGHHGASNNPYDAVVGRDNGVRGWAYIYTIVRQNLRQMAYLTLVGIYLKTGIMKRAWSGIRGVKGKKTSPD